MGFTIIDFINLFALLVSIVGTYIMFYFSPNISSKTILYRRAALNDINKKDAHKNKMVRRGMFLLFIGFMLQAIAIFLNVALK